MVSMKEKFIVKKKGISIVVNPEFIPETTEVDQIIKYFDVHKYKVNAKVLDVHYGRGKTYLVQDPYNRRVIIRHYWRGGLIGKVLGDKFLSFFGSSHRAFREYDLLQTMKKMGLPVPKPIAAKEEKSLFFIRNDIVMLEIPGTKNLGEILSARRLTDEEIAKIGDAVGKLFKAGIYHSDLNINNILFDGADNVWIVDFDKCVQRTIGKKQYHEMVNRLKRSFDKFKEERNNFYWSEYDFSKLLPAIKSSYEKNY